MKKYSILALTLVLTAALFTGCGCRNTKPNTAPTTMPTTMPTTQATTEPTTATTRPTETTIPAETNATIDNGNGPLEDGTNATENTVTGENRARHNVPNGR